MQKHTEQEVRDHIRRYGIGRASEDVKEVAKDMAAEEFDALSRQKAPAFEMPGGEVLRVRYNRKPIRSTQDRPPIANGPCGTVFLTTTTPRRKPTCKRQSKG